MTKRAKKPATEISAPPILPPTFGSQTLNRCLVWLRRGRGRQLAHLEASFLVSDVYRGQRWSDRSRRWTSRRLILGDGILADEVDQADPVVKRAIRGAGNGRPRCTHEHHFLPHLTVALPVAPRRGLVLVHA